MIGVFIFVVKILKLSAKQINFCEIIQEISLKIIFLESLIHHRFQYVFE